MSDFLERISKLSPKRLALLALEQQEEIERLRKRTVQPIAIVGMSCRFPGGVASPELFWDLLRNGRDAITEVPADRWNIDDYYDPEVSAAGKMSTRWGGFLQGLADFDADFFGITPREAANMDPQQRLVLEVAWEALERAGYAPDSFARSRTGVFIGVCNSDYFQVNAGDDPRRIDAWLASGGAPSVCAGRLSYVLGLQGPSLSVDTSCSSSLVAIHLACQSLRSGECTQAIAGGVNVILRPEITVALSRAKMMAADGRCKAFDSRADGFVRAEGCGLIVLKPLADAQAAGDPILAVIRGTASNQDGRSNNLTAPNGVSQEAVIREALTMANLEPTEISVVEAHGTGTALGDPIEIQALAAALGPGRLSSRSLLVGSVKTNIGHLESAAGVAGLMKAVLTLEHRAVPPHLHLETLNPHVDWSRLPVSIPRTLTPLDPDAPGFAGISSFGFSGTNGHVIVGQAPARAATDSAGVGGRRPYLLPIAARTPAALLELAQKYAAFLAPDGAGAREDLDELCYTASTGRSHFEHRLAVMGADRAALVNGLTAYTRGRAAVGMTVGRVTSNSEVVFLFSGQGAQSARNGRELYEREPVFRRVIDECDAALAGQLGRSLPQLLAEPDAAVLGQTAFLQPMMFAFQIALAELWKSWGVTPAAVAGHSLGEISAACVAGVFDPADGMRLVAARGRLMQSLEGDGRMAAIMADEGTVRAALDLFADSVSIAAINAPNQTVISGWAPSIDKLLGMFRERGIEVHPLDVSHAFHSPQMDAILADFELEARRIRYRAPRIEVYSNLSGAPWADAQVSDMARYWRRHAREPVQFARTMSALQRAGYRVFLEISPNPVLLGLGRQCFATKEALWLASVRKDRGEIEQMVDSASRLYTAGSPISWSGYYAARQHRRVLLPTYPFQRRRHWSAPAHQPVARGLPVPAPTRDWVYALEWRAAPEISSSRPDLRGDAGSHWIVSARTLAEGSAFVSACLPHGVRCSLMVRTAGDNTVHVGGRVVSHLSPGAVASALSELIHASGQAQALVFLAGTVPAGDDVASAVVEECGAASVCLRALSAAKLSVPLWILTQGSQGPGTEQSDCGTQQAGLWGWGRVASLEHPGEFGGLIDLDPSMHEPDIKAVLDVIGSGSGEDQLVRRAGQTLAARLARRELPQNARVPWKSDRAYLVTGWMGGLGLLVARWLAEQGVGQLVLVGRREFKRGAAGMDEAAELIDALEARGIKYAIEQADVADRAAMSRIVARFGTSLPQLAGVFHVAGQLSAGTIETMDERAFDTTVRAKVAGAQILDQLTRGLPLDCFVLFSSTAAVLGAHGLAHYAAANAVLDSIARACNAAGCAALSVNWGTWARLRAASGEAQAYFRSSGMLPMDPGSALGLIEPAIAAQQPVLMVAAIDWEILKPVYEARRPRPMLQDMAGGAAQNSDAGSYATPTVAPWRFEDVPEAFRSDELTERVRAEVARAMGRDNPAEIEPGRGFFEMGMDSLMSVELRTSLARRIGRELPSTLTFNYPNVTALAAFLGRLLFTPSPTEPRITVQGSTSEPEPRAGSHLSEEHLEQMLADRLGSL